MRAFTAIDLIVVIVIVGILLAVVIPQVLNAIRADNKNRSRSQMKMLALALQNHHDNHLTFPPLFFSAEPQRRQILNPTNAAGCYSWLVRVLPYLEEDPLYQQIKTASDHFTLDSTLVKLPSEQGSAIAPATISLSVLQSQQLGQGPPGVSHIVALPSTRQPLLTTTVLDDEGHEVWRLPPDGMIIPDNLARGQSMARMSDGTSRTAVLCETREQARSNWFKPQQMMACGFLPGDSIARTTPPLEYYPYIDFSQGSSDWVYNPQTGDRTALNYGPDSPLATTPLAYNPAAADPLARDWGPSSGNLEVTIHGMGDGSAQEIENSIDPKVYFMLITARGNPTPLPPPMDEQ